MKNLLPLFACGVGLLVPATSVADDQLHPIAADVAGKLANPDAAFVMIVELKTGTDRADALVAAMVKPTRETHKEPGNLAYELSVDTEEPNQFVLYEKWKNVAALDSHLKQPYLTTLLAAFGDVLAEPPKVTVRTPIDFD